MTVNILTAAAALSDHDLLARLDVLASKEREASVQLVAHLAALDGRPAAYAAQGFGSLFGYCTQALRLSEDAACNRIAAARVCRRFPLILDLLASGALSLTSVRLLARHLTPENHGAVLAKARDKTLREIEALVAELAPRADVPSTVRRLATVTVSSPVTPGVAGRMTTLPLGTGATPSSTPWAADASATPGTSMPTALPMARAVVQATAPQRYRIQFTVGQGTHDALRRLQALLRREVPDGDPAAIVDRALRLLLEQVEKAKLGATTRPQRAIRPAADNVAGTGASSPPSRHIPAHVKRAVWRRDGGRCAFISATGQRCTETTFLELHHRRPHARQGLATVQNVALHCRRHNVYEAERVFGPRPRPAPAGRSPTDG